MSVPTLESRLKVREKPFDRKPVMYQKWRDLLFLHWEYDPEDIQKTLPNELTVDTYNGKAYIGIVPFFMKDIRPRFCPTVPGLSNFMEINLRTYVYNKSGTPGVWFYSLDANNWFAVKIARKFFCLPYFDSRMASISIGVNTPIEYYSHRRGTGEDSKFYFMYQETEKIDPVEDDSLEFFLIERYILFSHCKSNNKLYHGQVQHNPYLLSNVKVDYLSEGLISLAGINKPNREPDHIIMSKGVEVEVYSIEEANNL